MQIIIDILPEEYEAICKVKTVINVIPFRLAQVIKNGIVLPENHGKLIDGDAFERRCMFDANIEDMQDVIYALRDYPAIIEGTEGDNAHS